MTGRHPPLPRGFWYGIAAWTIVGAAGLWLLHGGRP